ncbi:hypothetical protein [Brevundimonas aurantiaca]|jgi:hypothetical protein|uniref:hypothetical protein n=1 Tax=Brevundimonas aurantiaca TaxID=74316 RepID=UPI001D1863F3|nr:hypothetical protein [Brevundimonas aurantiaca]MCC4293384.1 hypothetical protein [Brevundimonas aurantiaca]
MQPRKILRTRIQQGDIAVLALELAAQRANGTISTTALKKFLIDKFKPTEGDAIPTANGYTPLFDQIVGNLVSNRKTPTSMFAKGYASYTGHGIQITQAGRDFLKTVPR